MKIEDVQEDVLRQIIRDCLSRHVPTMNMDRFEALVTKLTKVVFLHITSYRKEDDLND